MRLLLLGTWWDGRMQGYNLWFLVSPFDEISSILARSYEIAG